MTNYEKYIVIQQAAMRIHAHCQGAKDCRGCELFNTPAPYCEDEGKSTLLELIEWLGKEAS